MSNINVLQRTQKIVVNSASGTVSIINAGPVGPAGLPGVSGDVTDAELAAAIDTRVAVAGDTMTGPLILSEHPTVPFQAATMQFVLDTIPSEGGGGSGTGIDGGAPDSVYGGTTPIDGGTP
jgi:hypothetical protein